jgi:hypothetical protein
LINLLAKNLSLKRNNEFGPALKAQVEGKNLTIIPTAVPYTVL